MREFRSKQGYLRKTRNRRRRLVRMYALVGLCLLVFGLITPVKPTVQSEFVPTASTPNLPFDLPTFNSPKKVFAHYFPPYPMSIDNVSAQSDYYATQYLSPTGERGKHSAYGGFLRDRPYPLNPNPAADWKFQNLRLEVYTAATRGLDGFTVDILTRANSTNPIAGVPMQLIQAAATISPNFKVMLMPDMNGELGSMSQSDLAAEINKYAKQPSVFRLSDGRLVVSPYLAENKSASWWAQFISIMKSSYNETVALVPVFLDAPSNINAFASVSYGMSNWGGRNPAFNPVTNVGPNSPVGVVNRVHALGKIWMQPVSFQDSRPNQGIYDEAENTQNLRNTWKIATDTNSEWVQMTTWNDYSEGATFGPSQRHLFAPLDINSYYLTRFKSGTNPTIVRDTMYLSYRTQFAAARPSYPETRLMQLRSGSSPARDTIEVLTFMTAATQVYVQVGSKVYSCTVPAGVGTCLFPLLTGRPYALAQRNGQSIAQIIPQFDVLATPYVQNLDYTVTGSR